MSNTQYVFLAKTKIPSRDVLQNSVTALGFDLQLDPDLDLLGDEGFSPCTLEGRVDVGFELGVGAVSELSEAPDLQLIAEAADFYITMTWGGRMRDCAAALIVGTALAKDFGAIVSYEGEPPYNARQLEAEARAVLLEARKEK